VTNWFLNIALHGTRLSYMNTVKTYKTSYYHTSHCRPWRYCSKRCYDGH